MWIWWWWENWIELSFQLWLIVNHHYSFWEMLNLELWKKFKSLLQLHNLFTYVHMLFFMMFKQSFSAVESRRVVHESVEKCTQKSISFFFLTELASSWHDVCARDWVKIKFDVWLSVTQHAHLNENSRWLMMILAAVVIFEGDGEKKPNCYRHSQWNHFGSGIITCVRLRVRQHVMRKWPAHICVLFML